MDFFIFYYKFFLWFIEIQLLLITVQEPHHQHRLEIVRFGLSANRHVSLSIVVCYAYARLSIYKQLGIVTESTFFLEFQTAIDMHSIGYRFFAFYCTITQPKRIEIKTNDTQQILTYMISIVYIFLFYVYLVAFAFEWKSTFPRTLKWVLFHTKK